MVSMRNISALGLLLLVGSASCTTLMTVNGGRTMPDGGIGFTNATEIIRLSSLEGEPQQPCFQPNVFPIAQNLPVGTFIYDVPLVCGGFYSSYCLRYETTNDSWVPFTFLEPFDGRYYSAPRLTDSLWLLSRRESIYQLDEDSEKPLITDFETGLPVVVKRGHNLLAIDETTLFLVNGIEDEAQTAWYYSMADKKWTSVQPYPDGVTYQAAAGVITQASGEKEVLVAGGYHDSIDGMDISFGCYIFNLSSMQWRSCTPLLEAVSGSSTIQYEDTVLVVGGRTTGDIFLDTIYKYEVASDSWTPLDERLSFGRDSMAAFLIPDDFC